MQAVFAKGLRARFRDGQLFIKDKIIKEDFIEKFKTSPDYRAKGTDSSCKLSESMWVEHIIPVKK